jgi:hypothetical protein
LSKPDDEKQVNKKRLQFPQLIGKPPSTRRSIIVLENDAPQGSRQYSASAFAYPAKG